MGKYRDHREPRRRRNEDEAGYLSERASEPSYFQRPAPARAQPVDAEVMWFNESKGFGFVKLQDGAEVYLHIRALEAAGRGSVSEGTPLKVTVEESQRGRQVAQVLEIGETAIRRPSHTRSAEAVTRAAEAAGEIRGTVKWYNPEKGFGFIAPNDGDKDVFVHATALGRSGMTALADGQEVLMECRQGKKGLKFTVFASRDASLANETETVLHAAMNIAFDSARRLDYLSRLNERQRAAVEHGGGKAAGPLLVIAGAGSGKTNTLAHRVVHLIVNGADPRRILLMTFSRRAAVEMTQRVQRIAAQVLGEKAAIMTDGLTWAGTFHSIGARLLRDYALDIGLDPAFTIHDREDSADLMNLIRHELGLSKTESRFPAKQTCLAIYSRSVNAQTPLDEVLADDFPWCRNWADELKKLFAAYVAAKQAQNVLDYDDLLLYWAEMAKEATFAEEIGSRFDHILVDEYQDTNRLQAAILLALKPDGSGVTVVGDDAQSIYAFRAADVRNILDFPKSFTPEAEVVTLDRNYRSTEPILAAANAVIAEAEERFTKDLWTERKSSAKPALVTVRDDTAQATYVCAAILAEREAGTRLKEQAVLFRTTHHSGSLEVELTRRNIPFVKFGGLKFLDSAHVKDVLATLRFSENPRDRVAGFRVLQLLPGVGPSFAGQVIDAMETALDPTMGLQALRAPQRVAEDWPGFVTLFEELRRKSSSWPSDLERVRLWYEPHLERIHESAAARRGDLMQLEQIAAGYPSRERFLTDLTLDPPAASSDHAGPPHRDDDYLFLSTIHSAKGQEWKNVYVLNVVDGCIPACLGAGERKEIEEERRLLYVAMTRAKDSLHLMMPQRFYVENQVGRGDRHVYGLRSRFIPEYALSYFEQTTWPEARAEAGMGARSRASIDLRAKMRGAWS